MRANIGSEEKGLGGLFLPQSMLVDTVIKLLSQEKKIKLRGRALREPHFLLHLVKGPDLHVAAHKLMQKIPVGLF